MNNIQQNNNNSKNKKTKKETTTNVPFRIVTQNIRGLTSPSKQTQVAHWFNINNMAVLGLAETKLTNKTAKHIYKNENFQFYYHNDSNSPLSQGVGLLISNDYARSVQKSDGFKGRILYVDMFLKGRIKLRIIQVYLHANFHSDKKDEIEEVHNYLTTLIEDSQRHSQHLMVMGDFNVDPLKYKEEYNRRGQFHWKYRTLHTMFIKNMVDTVELHHDVDNHNPYNTYFPQQQGYNPSRLDLIYISRDLVEDTLNSNILETEHFTSDHLAVYASFTTSSLFNKKSIAQLKQHKIRRCIFSYDNTSEDEWIQFAALTDSKLRDLHNNMEIHSRNDLTKMWKIIQKGIMNAAFETLPHHYTSIHQDSLPEEIEESKKNLRLISKILYYISVN